LSFHSFRFALFLSRHEIAPSAEVFFVDFVIGLTAPPFPESTGLFAAILPDSENPTSEK
jgi:hypothetical protein